MLRRSMLFVVAFFVFPTIASADPAVESTSGSFGASINKARTSDGWSDTNTYSVGGDMTMPLGERFGFKLSGNYAATDSDLCDVDWRSLGAQLFVRDPSVGRIGVSYALSKSGTCTPAGDVIDDDFDQDSYGINAEYYFAPLTIGVSRSRTEYEYLFPHTDYAFVNATWYPDVNFSVGISAGALDAEDDRTLRFDYQPTFLNNAASVSLTVRTSVDTDWDTATVGFTYYFGDKVDLKTRDRNYR
jgi:hypothetical protein